MTDTGVSAPAYIDSDFVIQPTDTDMSVSVVPPNREMSAHPANWPLPAGGILPLDPGLELDLGPQPGQDLTQDSLASGEFQLFSYHPGSGCTTLGGFCDWRCWALNSGKEAVLVSLCCWNFTLHIQHI